MSKNSRHNVAVKKMLLAWAVQVKYEPTHIANMGMGPTWGPIAQRAFYKATGSKNHRDRQAVAKLRAITKGKRNRRRHAGSLRVKVAWEQIGTLEVPVNTGPQVQRYQSATGLGGTGWPWCVAFVSWTVWHTRGRRWAYRGAGVYHMEGWLRLRGKLRNPNSYNPQPGDIVTLNYGEGHTGIVYDPRPIRLGTIEGNTSSGDGGSQDNGGGVFPRWRNRDDVRYYGKP